jgi:hypothetical protein
VPPKNLIGDKTYSHNLAAIVFFSLLKDGVPGKSCDFSNGQFVQRYRKYRDKLRTVVQKSIIKVRFMSF